MSTTRTLIAGALASAALLSPFGASGQTTAELLAEITELLARIEALQAQLGVVQGTVQGGSGTAPAIPVNAGTTCAVTRILKAGMSGEDVRRLQQFLAQDASIYPEGLVTGYYGALTTAAVQRWQAAHGIVSSGTPESTGYGQVGPRTATAMGLACGVGATGATDVSGSMKVSPVSGAAPLTVSVEASVNLTGSCNAATYILDWGDGVGQETIVVPQGSCRERTLTFTHVYPYGGTYTIRLSSGPHHSTATVQVSGSVGGAAVSGVGSERLNVLPTSGTVPLRVLFSGVVSSANAAWRQGVPSFNVLDFGDGASVQIPLPTLANTSQTFSVEHTYVKSGSYEAVMYQGARGTSALVGRATVTVTDPIATVQQRINATPTSGAAPLSVMFSGTVTGANAAWNSGGVSVLDFGDGTSVEVPLPPTRSGVNDFTVQHVYGAPGSYTARLHQGRPSDNHPQIGTVTITVGN